MRLSDGPHRPDRALAALAILTATMVSACNDRARTHEKEDQVDSKARTTRGGTAGQYFTDITRQVGLDFVHDNGADGNLDLPEIIVSGVALFDFDNDADLDIYFTNGNHNLRTGEVSDGPTNRLYRQEPDGRFTDVTARSGLGDCGYGAGVAVGDIDNDGYADVYVTNIGHDQLYRNRGDGTFENITKSAGIRVDGFSSSAAFLDYDRDGYLDLYIARYVQWSPKDCYSDKGTPDYCGPLAFPPARDVLLHNTGDGAFRDVTEHAGISSASAAAGLGVVCEDFNDDGWIDIYVANDAYANNLWVNQHDGRFVDDALVLGAAYNMHGMPEAGMGVVAADFDGDEDYDLFMTHLARETNTLYRNEGPAGG
ncbi:MAG: FG-GAP repeat domain-containing protein, partial [Phycisphaerae bacterium]